VINVCACDGDTADVNNGTVDPDTSEYPNEDTAPVGSFTKITRRFASNPIVVLATTPSDRGGADTTAQLNTSRFNTPGPHTTGDEP
jgi:hypothetical protein